MEVFMKKFLAVVSLLTCLSLIITGCGKLSKSTESENDTVSETSENDSTNEDTASSTEQDMAEADNGNGEAASEAGNPGKFESIADISEYWNNLYTSNEAAINAYEGMPIMELVTPGLCFVTGVQYDILNIYNKDGRFEGELMLAGYPGFEEKKGPQISFGYEFTLEEDSQYGTDRAGDKKVEIGNCDLDKGYYYSESYTDRTGVKISRDINEFALQEDKSMCALVIEGGTIGFNSEENLTTSYIFIRANEGQYDFAVANSTVGTDYEVLHLEKNMTKEMAMELFKKEGASIVYSGGIKDGVFYLD
jgi:hypothetical protein